MKKKASLNLSVNAIVILVLAVVLLGLALAFIRGMFGKMTSKMGEIVDITQIEAKPTADMPITMPNKITIKTNGRTTVQIGFYNIFGSKCDVSINSTPSCKDEDGNPVKKLGKGSLLTISAPPSDNLDGGKSVGFNAIFTENGVGTTGKLYVCSLIIKCGNYNKTKQFYVEVTS